LPIDPSYAPIGADTRSVAICPTLEPGKQTVTSRQHGAPAERDRADDIGGKRIATHRDPVARSTGQSPSGHMLTRLGGLSEYVHAARKRIFEAMLAMAGLEPVAARPRPAEILFR
jgi:hypothetical protein